MTICKYFLQGNCRFGDRCRFEHPQDYSSGSSGYRASQGNFYDDGNAGSGYRSRGAAGGGQQSRGGQYDSRSGNFRGGDYSGHGGNYRGADYGSRAADYRSPDRDQNRYDDGNQPRSGRHSPNRNAPFQQTTQTNRFQQQQLATDTRPSFTEILDWISEEMEIWEKSGMWPFSTFAFSHSVRSLPGLDDMSMEEVRYFAYEAQASGQFSNFVAWIQELTQDYHTKRQHLYKPTGSFRTSLMNAVEEIVKTDAVQGSVTAAGQKAGDTKPIMYAGNQQQLSAGFTAAAVQASSGFDSRSANQPSSFMFGNIVKPTPSFAATPFHATSQPASSAQPPLALCTGSFTQSPQSTQQFVTQSASSQQILFGKSILTAAVADSTVLAAGFGPSKPAAADASASRGSQGPSSCYTPLADLSADDKAAFEAEEFTLGSIPTCPPPREFI